jgi:hypothetical protein
MATGRHQGRSGIAFGAAPAQRRMRTAAVRAPTDRSTALVPLLQAAELAALSTAALLQVAALASSRSQQQQAQTQTQTQGGKRGAATQQAPAKAVLVQAAGTAALPPATVGQVQGAALVAALGCGALLRRIQVSRCS